MGISCEEHIVIKTQDEFHAIDKVATGLAFDIQNRVGAFYDESIYQRILSLRCDEAHIKTQREVEIRVTFKDFCKTYKMDLLLDNGVVYELKAVKALKAAHRQQLINYLLLTGLRHGKLLNFRPKSVEYEYVSTSLTPKDRYSCSLDSSLFSALTPKCETLKNIVCGLLREWGAYLDHKLYNEALIYLLGGYNSVVLPVAIVFDSKIMGRQRVQLLNERTAFHSSSINKAIKSYEKNIRRFIAHTGIEAVQWVNFNRDNITLTTIHPKK